jgi:16S rRNA C967 or C1407 C5-methylase (RsmB/RsmF family)/NOL1/NOP2/fmu family ribosome biogenesis protein
MFPEDFIKRIFKQEYLNASVLVSSLMEPSPVSIRINRQKWPGVPVRSEKVPWSSSGYYLDTRPSFTMDPLFHAGCYYPQEASGMFLEHILHQIDIPLSDLRVLDLCGAPGGKSLILSDLTANGLLVSNEVIRSRSWVLAETLTKWGSRNCIVTNNDPSAFGRLKGYFDLILVDAPCSGEGMFRNRMAVNEWSVENTIHCAERQKRILMDIWPCLAENGILIYSTCTFNPEENEGNIRWLCDIREAESMEINVEGFPGVKKIEYQGITGYGFHPGTIRGEGLFFSVVRKREKQDVLIPGNRVKNDFSPTKADRLKAIEYLSDNEAEQFRLMDDLFSLPCRAPEFLFLNKFLNIIKRGVKLASVKKGEYIPAHDLALSVNLRKNAFPVVDSDLLAALKYLRRESFYLPDAPLGWCVLSHKGVALGFIKNLGRRLNNYYPVEWRIRMDIPETINILDWE